MTELVKPFKSPSKFTLFATTDTGATTRVGGRDTLQEIADLQFVHSKSFPNMTYRLFEATWKEIKWIPSH